METKGRQWTPKWSPRGAKVDTKRIRSKTQNMQKSSEGRSKIDFWRPGGGAKGAKKRQKRASRKVKEGREAKLGSRGPKMAPKSRNGSLQRAMPIPGRTVLEPRAPPWGVGGKINLPPRKEKRKKHTTDLVGQLPATGSNTPLAYGQANLLQQPYEL